MQVSKKVLKVLLTEAVGQSNVVAACVVQMRAASQNEQHENVFAVPLPLPAAGAPFVDWPDVSETLLLDWARNAVGADEWAARESGCAAFLEEMIAQQEQQPARWVDLGG